MRFGAEARGRLAVLPVFLVIPWHCNLLPPPSDAGLGVPVAFRASQAPDPPAEPEPRSPAPAPVASAVDAKAETIPGRVASVAPRVPTTRAVTLADEVVVKAISLGQPAFLRCWARAQRVDGIAGATKVKLHVELDARGTVVAAQCDSESPVLTSCLALVAHRLPFPAPGKPAVVDVPLMFR